MSALTAVPHNKPFSFPGLVREMQAVHGKEQMRFVILPATKPTAPGTQNNISSTRLSSPIFLKPLPLSRHSKGMCHAPLFFSPPNAKNLP